MFNFPYVNSVIDFKGTIPLRKGKYERKYLQNWDHNQDKLKGWGERITFFC